MTTSEEWILAAIVAGLLINLFVLGDRVLKYNENALADCQAGYDYMHERYSQDIRDYSEWYRGALQMRDETLVELQAAIDAGWRQGNHSCNCSCSA